MWSDVSQIVERRSCSLALADLWKSIKCAHHLLHLQEIYQCPVKEQRRHSKKSPGPVRTSCPLPAEANRRAHWSPEKSDTRKEGCERDKQNRLAGGGNRSRKVRPGQHAVIYAMGVTWEDNVWFEVVEDGRRSRSGGQTSEVTVYQIHGFTGKTLPFAVTVIDTPGYGNTRGTERDVATRSGLLELIQPEAGVCEINAVGLVLKASDNRLSGRLRYVLDSVASLLDEDLRNDVLLVTHSDGGPPDNVVKALEESRLDCVRNHASLPLYFLFNNRQNTRKTMQYRIILRLAMGPHGGTNRSDLRCPDTRRTTKALQEHVTKAQLMSIQKGDSQIRE